MSRDRASGNRAALFVGCLFVLVIASTLRWRASAPAAPIVPTTQEALIDLLPQRVGAEIRAADVLSEEPLELVVAPHPAHVPTPSEAWPAEADRANADPAVAPLATPNPAILSQVKAAEPTPSSAAELPAFDLLTDAAYQRSRAQALATRDAINDVPAARSPALSKIFRQLHSREALKQRATAVPTSPTVQRSEPVVRPGIDLTAQPALGPPEGALCWPAAKQLFDELATLNDPHCQLWARKVQSGMDALASAQSIYDPTTRQALAELDRLTLEANRILHRIQNNADKSKMLIAAYGLRRRADVWSAIAKAASPNVAKRAVAVQNSVDRRAMLDRIRDARKMLGSLSSAKAWSDYFKLDELHAMAMSPDVHDVAKRTPLAMAILRRCNIATPDDQQRLLLNKTEISNLDRELRRWITQPVDLQALVYAIEEFETHPNSRRAQRVTDYWQGLRWSVLPEYTSVAEAIDLHYRNANVRVSVTEGFMNRLIPAMQNVRSPIREHILGAQVTGRSTSNMKMNVDLMEDPKSIRLRLQADGRLTANTQSKKGPVTLRNFNQSDFVIEKLFVVNHDEVETAPARAFASGESAMIGMQTRYDTFPVVGAMVRRIARQRAVEMRPIQRKIFENHVADKASRNIDAKVNRQMNATQKHIENNFIKPLYAIDLEPKTISLSSSEHDAYYRGRLAGDHQLAAFTARPKELDNSYLSMQLHDSAVNNFLRQISLDGQSGTIREVMAHVLRELDLKEAQVPEEVPNDVKISLAKHDSFVIDCDDDRVSFTFGIARMETERKTWKNFHVRVAYTPKVNGFQCELYRDGVIELPGRRLRGKDQIALRAIFCKVFAKNRPIPMIHPEVAKDRRMQDLQIDQFVARDGWIGISVGQKPKVQTATKPRRRRNYSRR